MMRIAESYCSPIQTTSSRENSVSRTAESFIPAEFDFETGRIGDGQLGSYRLGGGVVRGIATASSRDLELPRTSESFVEAVEAESDRDLTLPRTAESFVETIETDAELIIPFWRVGGMQLREIVEETRSWDSLTLTFRADKQLVTNRLRPLDQEAGKLDILETADGGYIAVDRVDGANTYQLNPPTGRQPPRLAGTFLVNEYSEEVVDQQGGEYQATVTLVPDGPRTTDSGYTETVGSGEWEFDFETGTIATRRVNAGVGSSASSGTRDKRLQLILTDMQVQVLEESATALNAARVREVPDGKNIAEDNSPGDRNTVAVASPNEDVFESGDYVVQSWETTMQNDDWHRVSVTLKESN